MRYFATIGDCEVEVDVRSTPEGLALTLDGTTYHVDLAAVEEGKKYAVLVDHRSYAVSVDGDGRKLSLIVSGRAYHLHVEDERERAIRGISGGVAEAGGVIESVMPGIVRRVEVTVGTVVTAGDRLLILEAMKMENEICAENDGVVEEVHVCDGQAVEAGQVLVTLGPTPDPSDAAASTDKKKHPST